MPKTVTKRCIGCRAPLRYERKQLKTDRRDMRRRPKEGRIYGRGCCKACFDCRPLSEFPQ